MKDFASYVKVIQIFKAEISLSRTKYWK